MTEDEERLLRDYAAGKVAWAILRYQGYHFGWVLDGLDRLGLRQPIVGEGGPNDIALDKGRDWLRKALAKAAA